MSMGIKKAIELMDREKDENSRIEKQPRKKVPRSKNKKIEKYQPGDDPR